MTIHKEGYSILAGTTLLFAGLYLILEYFFPNSETMLTVVLVLELLVFITFLQFFRKPNKNLQLGENHVLAPADGKVVVIEEVQETEYFKDKRLQISIFMSPINVHNNLNPVTGVCTYFRYHAGKFLVAWHPKSSTENERTTSVVKTPMHGEVLFRQIAGALAKRIVAYISEGQNVEQGQEFGFIKFGSRVDVFLPIGTVVNVTLNQKTTGGQTIIATFAK